MQSSDYRDWLCDIAGGMNDYQSLADQLYSTRFEYFVDGDVNRARDGERLRVDYSEETGFEANRNRDVPCSILEMLVALARRMDYQITDPSTNEDNTGMYFWEMLDNLGLDDLRFTDSEGVYDPLEVGRIIDLFVRREYNSDGVGGIFPLKNPVRDQREVELWEQMNQYIFENFEF